jgi:hypothetical protein
MSTNVTKNPKNESVKTPGSTDPILSGIRDNHKRGLVGDFLRKKIKPGSKLSFVSAYFTCASDQIMGLKKV